MKRLSSVIPTTEKARRRLAGAWRRLVAAAIVVLLSSASFRADAQPAIPARTVDFFMGVDFNYRDIMLNRLFEVLVNLTPGAKWNMGRGWQLAGEVFVPVLNDYGKYYGRVRLNVAALSKEMHFGDRWFLKASGGVFSNRRYGLDLKGMTAVTDWLALEAQVGLTGYAYLTDSPEVSSMKRVTGHVGANFYIPSYDTEFRLRGGRYVYEDYGGSLDVMRHFKHCTAGVFGRYSNRGGKSYGFQFIVLLPPYKRTAHRVNFRPKSYFKLNYVTAPDGYGNKRYATDPEENDREGWFDPATVKWGVNATHTDFEYRDKHRDEERKKSDETTGEPAGEEVQP